MPSRRNALRATLDELWYDVQTHRIDCDTCNGWNAEQTAQVCETAGALYGEIGDVEAMMDALIYDGSRQA